MVINVVGLGLLVVKKKKNTNIGYILTWEELKKSNQDIQYSVLLILPVLQ